jgi:hypothetical protein
VLEAVDQMRRGRDVEDLLGDEGACDRRPVERRPAATAPPPGQEHVDRHHLQHRDELLVLGAERAQAFLKIGKEIALQAAPQIG